MRNAAIWTSILHVIEKHVKATSLGIFRCMNNLALTVFPAVVGLIHDETPGEKHGYEMVSLFLTILSALSLVAAIIVFSWDLSKRKIDGPEIVATEKLELSFEEPKSNIGNP